MDYNQTADGLPPTLDERSGALLEQSARLHRRCQQESAELSALYKRSAELIGESEALLKSLPRRTPVPERW